MNRDLDRVISFEIASYPSDTVRQEVRQKAVNFLSDRLVKMKYLGRVPFYLFGSLLQLWDSVVSATSTYRCGYGRCFSGDSG